MRKAEKASCSAAGPLGRAWIALCRGSDRGAARLGDGEAVAQVTVGSLPARGRPPQAAARRPVGTWHDPDLGRPIAAPLERCAALLGVDLATVRELAAKVEPTSAPTAPGSGASCS